MRAPWPYRHATHGGRGPSWIRPCPQCVPEGDDASQPSEADAEIMPVRQRSYIPVHSEARDAIADHDNSDHEQKETHDRHIVLHEPLP